MYTVNALFKRMSLATNTEILTFNNLLGNSKNF